MIKEVDCACMHELTDYTGLVWNCINSPECIRIITTSERTVSSVEVNVNLGRVKFKVPSVFCGIQFIINTETLYINNNSVA